MKQVKTNCQDIETALDLLDRADEYYGYYTPVIDAIQYLLNTRSMHYAPAWVTKEAAALIAAGDCVAP